ncbi:hypothetical protein DXX93_19030 [Thalassotalea euphylliae]|uniref:Transporter n=1 Tax=Thalassotalea euphylliae TaxID=1655234 RepID=A0A3E0TX03_9GAMM|nr:hypothetical protein [Thalassotalea euphylliae]REL28452.1 hypothetical protein DXX93_19030 [Thalassotalea euphylliae]
MNKKALWGLTLGALTLVSTAYADEENLSPFVQELLLSNSGDNQAHGEWQWAVSNQYLRQPASKLSILATELEYGISSRLTLGLELPYAYLKPDQDKHINGIGNVEVSALYRLLAQDNYYLSLAVEKSFDTAATEVADTQEDGWEVDLIYLTQIASNHQLKTSFITEFEDDESRYQVAIAWLYQHAALATAVELNWYDAVEHEVQENPVQQTENDDQAWQIALSAVWQYDNDQEVQLGIPIGLSSNIAGWGVTVIWSIEWE